MSSGGPHNTRHVELHLTRVFDQVNSSVKCTLITVLLATCSVDLKAPFGDFETSTTLNYSVGMGREGAHDSS